MRVLKDIEALHSWRRDKTELGFVPTMGALHDGHMALVKKATQSVDCVLVSIFVNPTQFDQAQDLETYPHTLEEDLALLSEAGVDAVFVPDTDQIYPQGERFRVHENDLSHQFCGAHRKGHFSGVLTVVMKLFQLVRPDFAYFGEKDYQQLLLIKAMVRDFFLPVKIVACPTVRNRDGLALSSRNSRLSREALNLAPMFYQTLVDNDSIESKKSRLYALGFRVEYLQHYEDRLLAAVYLDDVRLIDNVPIKEST